MSKRKVERIQPGTVGMSAGDIVRLDAAIPLTLGGIWELLKSRSIRVDVTIEIPKIRRGFVRMNGGGKKETMSAVAVIGAIAFKAHENMRVGVAQPRISLIPATFAPPAVLGEPIAVAEHGVFAPPSHESGTTIDPSMFSAENALRQEPISHPMGEIEIRAGESVQIETGVTIEGDRATVDATEIREPLKDPAESDWLRP